MKKEKTSTSTEMRLLRDQFTVWLEELAPWGNIKKYIIFEADQNPGLDVRVKFYTKNYEYFIRAQESTHSGWKAYLGASYSSRKPRAGENWTRGRDLPDGEFCQETWDKILIRILQNELVAISSYSRRPEDEVAIPS